MYVYVCTRMYVYWIFNDIPSFNAVQQRQQQQQASKSTSWDVWKEENRKYLINTFCLSNPLMANHIILVMLSSMTVCMCATHTYCHTNLWSFYNTSSIPPAHWIRSNSNHRQSSCGWTAGENHWTACRRLTLWMWLWLACVKALNDSKKISIKIFICIQMSSHSLSNRRTH